MSTIRDGPERRCIRSETAVIPMAVAVSAPPTQAVEVNPSPASMTTPPSQGPPVLLASGAFERITGGVDAFYEAWDDFRGAEEEKSDDEADMGEDFDFDDDAEMRRRLPRLAALFLDTDG